MAAPSRTFHVAGVVDSKRHFVIDRREWHNSLADSLASGKCMLLHAHRQSGKSSAAREVASLLEARESSFCVLSCTLESLHTSDTVGMWRNLDADVHAALKSFRPPVAYAAVPALHDTRECLFTDAMSFQQFFAPERWGGLRVVLIMDEFDKLLSASGAVRDELLSALRGLRTMLAITAAAHSSPTALHAVLGIGVYRLLRLATQQESHPHMASPFNVSDAQSVPETTSAEVALLLDDFSRERGFVVPSSIVNDIYWRSGGHVGLISMLGQHLTQVCESRRAAGLGAIDDASWAERVGGSHLLGELIVSATVGSMLRSVGAARAKGLPAADAARTLLRDMLSAPEDAELDVGDATSARHDALEYLLSEGVIVAGRLSRGSNTYRITAPLLVPLIMREVGSRALLARMPSLPFPRRGDNSVDLAKAVLELLPFMSFAAIFHPYALLKSGQPCEYAYHFQLFDLMSHRSTEAGWRVLGETRNSSIPGPPRRLDLLIASNGHRCGLELLQGGEDFDKHVREQAPTYKTQQQLSSVLVINFATAAAGIVPRLSDALSDGVDVLQVLLDKEASTLTPFQVGSDGRIFRPLSVLRAHPELGAAAHLAADDLCVGIAHLSVTGAGGAAAAPTPLVSRQFVHTPSIARVEGVEYSVVAAGTVAGLLTAIATEQGLAAASLTLMHVAADGSASRVARAQDAAPMLAAAAAAAAARGSWLEVRTDGASPMRVQLL